MDRNLKGALIAAFDAASKGYSTDRVVADPFLNKIFVSECRRRGLSDTSAVLNRSLLNLRKKGELSGRPRPKRSVIADQDEYRFASEIAVRFLERRNAVTLDDVICDSALANEFDAIAKSIAPGYTSVQYRWAALNLRKKKRLSPELLSRVAPPISMINLAVSEIDIEQLPRSHGLYLFFTTDKALYAGETQNIRKRIGRHLEHSDNKGLAKWMWEFGNEALRLEIQVLNRSISTRVRKALELELIRSREPIFNVKR